MLNPKQREAVEAPDGPVLVVAGAGSGKTRTIAHRVAYLIEERGIRPGQIVAITFTKKAAGEMGDRLSAMLGERSWSVSAKTFHATGRSILTKNGYKHWTVADAAHSARTVLHCMKTLDINRRDYPPAQVRTAISTAKNNLVSVEAYQASSIFEHTVHRVYELYQHTLDGTKILDFDDLIMKTVTLFKKQPDIREYYQEHIKHLLVDEFQDTNTSQYEMAQLLSGGTRNLYVVGDPDQCLPSGTLIDTPKGVCLIEDIKVGDSVTCGTGGGQTAEGKVTNRSSRQVNERLVHITTKSGLKVSATLEHQMFWAWQNSGPNGLTYVYLMKDRKGRYRLGTCSNPAERIRFEKSIEGMLPLVACETWDEARYLETIWSMVYQIPTLPFTYRGGRGMSREYQEKVFTQFDGIVGAHQLMYKLGKTWQGIVAKQAVINQYGYTGPLPITLLPIGAKAKGRKTVHWGGKGANYHEFDDLEEARKFASKTAHDIGGDVIEKWPFIKGKECFATSAGNVIPGCMIPICNKREIIWDTVVTVTNTDYSGTVHDIRVDPYHNYVAQGVVVHNSIYAWRSADIRNILNFQRDYPDATVILMEQNYRSTRTILEAAHEVITVNQNRVDKELWTENDQGAPIMIKTAFDAYEEALMVADEICALQDKGFDPSDCAVLFRTNAQSRILEEAFVQRGMSYQIVGNVGFYLLFEVKLLVSYLRVLHNPGDDVNLAYIINRPARGIGDKSITRLQSAAHIEDMSLWQALQERSSVIHARARGSLETLVSGIKEMQSFVPELSARDLLGHLIRRIKYEPYITAMTDGETRWENVLELLDASAKCSSLHSLLEKIAMTTSTDLEGVKEGTKGVLLITLHQAKGLEFPVVFMVGVEDGLIPHTKSMASPIQLEEERRLCYVGMTRAMQQLFMFRASKRGSNFNPPSPFINDIPDHLKIDSGVGSDIIARW